MGAENLAPSRIRSPDRPARSESLYRLSYPSFKGNQIINMPGAPRCLAPAFGVNGLSRTLIYILNDFVVHLSNLTTS